MRQHQRTSGTHGSDELNISELNGRRVIEVVPDGVIEPLSQQLNWRLGAMHLARRHVHVIDKHHLATNQ